MKFMKKMKINEEYNALNKSSDILKINFVICESQMKIIKNL